MHLVWEIFQLSFTVCLDFRRIITDDEEEFIPLLVHERNRSWTLANYQSKWSLREMIAGAAGYCSVQRIYHAMGCMYNKLDLCATYAMANGPNRFSCSIDTLYGDDRLLCWIGMDGLDWTGLGRTWLAQSRVLISKSRTI